MRNCYLFKHPFRLNVRISDIEFKRGRRADMVVRAAKGTPVRKKLS